MYFGRSNSFTQTILHGNSQILTSDLTASTGIIFACLSSLKDALKIINPEYIYEIDDFV